MLLKKKLCSPSGFTLSEALVSVAILSLIALSLAAGIPAAMGVYRTVTAYSEASVLMGTLTTAVADELRYATGIETGEDGEARFDSATYGRGIAIQPSAEGRVLAGGYELLSDSVYTSGLVADVTVRYEDGVFKVDLSVGDGQSDITETELSIKPLNK